MKNVNEQIYGHLQLTESRIQKDAEFPSRFMKNFFCKIEGYNLEFIAISKNAGTYLRHLAVYAKTGQIAKSKKDAHDLVGYGPENGYLVPVNQARSEGTIRFAVWRDPVERLISCYKFFFLERHLRHYFTYLDLYNDPSFKRFMEFTRFELGKKDPLYQDEHFRRQSDYYSWEDVDYIVNIDNLDMFLREFNVPLIKGNTNYTHTKFELTDQAYINEIKELYKADYMIKTNY